MFKRLNNQGVRSERGFIVQVKDRFTVEYSEGSRRMDIEVEFGILANGNPCVNIDRSATSRWNGHSTDIPISEQDRIRENFIDAMKYMDLTTVVYGN